ncbi:Gfo/Idh/MocA family oxidoreductase [uncultured Draconibacterium sp.]|uniref:Gfo/Idh/MocA family protein n=1 Tax=uncultured Draconibacterium sp. TaxID=1573823 RepID=UPI0025EBB7F4|nr:Gfo/Idh/MocA family oxidoreductase [uncultured Draconibacterium sp.]
MENKKIRVGFIGLNPDSHWAATAHIPALKSLTEDFEVVGVANRSLESAQATAKALNLKFAFENPQVLIQSPEVDLVVVTVKVPYHFEYVKAALEAGKHVSCEHPLGNGLEETKTLADIAEKQGVVAVVGTQMVNAPEILYLKKLIEEGYVGEVKSTTLIGSGWNWANETVDDRYYLFDNANGANMLTIPLGHTLAGLTSVLGDFTSLKADMFNFYKTVNVADTGEVKPKDAEDQILVIGQLESGAAASVHYRGGLSKGTNLLWEINGTEGDIQVTGDNGHGQMIQLSIKGAKGSDEEMKAITIPLEMYKGLPDNSVARNVAQIYKLLAGDIRNNTRNAPTFQRAVALAELYDTIEKSAKK